VSNQTSDVVVCGAGIAGISTAYQLSVHHGVRNVVLVDERPPLSLTSDKSSEAYRNWWPAPDDAMVRLMNRSIDLLEDMAEFTDNRILLNRRGYLFATARSDRAQHYREIGSLAAARRAGGLRVHTGTGESPGYRAHSPTGWRGEPGGADLILDTDSIQRAFPYLAEDVEAVLHTRRCGWFSGQQLGMELLERSRAAGTTLINGRVVEVNIDGSAVAGVRVSQDGQINTISTRHFVNAAGPMLNSVGRLVDLDLPVFSELHIKASFRDHLGIVPRDAPLLVWDDPQLLEWSSDEAEYLAESDDTRRLVEQMPPGVHMRPEGKEHLILLWPYHTVPVPEVFPLEFPASYTEVALRGMARMVPGLTAYLDQLPKPYVDGGYYTRTRENRPIVCPAGPVGSYVHGALSGFGLMASSGTADLMARHITGSSLPDYADSFDLSRYDDPAYLDVIESWGEDGQL